jgi:hypothetical protein
MPFVRYALFHDLAEAQAALKEIESATTPDEKVILSIHEQKLPLQGGDLRHAETDARRGLKIGLLTGAVAGLIFGLVLAALNVLHISYIGAALFGLVIGTMIGGLSAGLYSTGLTSVTLAQLTKLWRSGNVLVTAEAELEFAIVRVERILKRHHAMVATG